MVNETEKKRLIYGLVIVIVYCLFIGEYVRIVLLMFSLGVGYEFASVNVYYSH